MTISERDFVSFELAGVPRKGRVQAISGAHASIKIAGGDPTEAWIPLDKLTHLPKR